MKYLILNYAPVFIQNLAISVYNYLQYRKRHKGVYTFYREYYQWAESANLPDLESEFERRLSEFIDHSVSRSIYYSRLNSLSLADFPVLEKEGLLNNFYDIKTISESDGEVSLTGGTTGASMKVVYTFQDVQERNALLDHFRAKYGYVLGKKTAWFSGKNLTRNKDLSRGICYRDDWINSIRFFSTFHIAERNFDIYWKAFTEFAPEYIVGFPSSVYDICVMALERGLSFHGVVRAFFPTAETILPVYREVIYKVLGCPLIDQYASSEGAPFILQCQEGRLHIHPLTGVFEVVDDNLEPTDEGEILVTSFTTHGTPLIRYRIGDRVKLAPTNCTCECGSAFPIVEYIDGRSSDFLWSPENGKVNLGNISNCTKDAPGIVCFQVHQGCPNAVEVKLVKGRQFTSRDEKKFIDAMRSRLGVSVNITINYVNEIPREKSGKFRIVKNQIAERFI